MLPREHHPRAQKYGAASGPKTALLNSVFLMMIVRPLIRSTYPGSTPTTCSARGLHLTLVSSHTSREKKSKRRTALPTSRTISVGVTLRFQVDPSRRSPLVPSSLIWAATSVSTLTLTSPLLNRAYTHFSGGSECEGHSALHTVTCGSRECTLFF